MNLIKQFHDEQNMDYRHLTNRLRLILREDFNSSIEVPKRTLEHYAAGDCYPRSRTVIQALAKMCKVTPSEMSLSLKQNIKRTA